MKNINTVETCITLNTILEMLHTVTKCHILVMTLFLIIDKIYF